LGLVVITSAMPGNVWSGERTPELVNVPVTVVVPALAGTLLFVLERPLVVVYINWIVPPWLLGATWNVTV